MAMISGIAANLVNNPKMINAAQKNSANMVSESEAAEPIPNGSANLPDFWAKFISLSNPWLANIKKPEPTRSMKSAKESALSETVVENNFFIAMFELGTRLRNNFLFWIC